LGLKMWILLARTKDTNVDDMDNSRKGHETNKNFFYAYSLSEYLSDIHLNFPVSETMGHKFFIGNHFFGVNLDKGSGPIESMEYVTLWYMNQVENISQRRKLQAIQMELFERSRLDNFSDLISFGIYGDQIASKEMLRGTQGTVKFFILGVVLMVVFMSFTFNHIAFGSKQILIIGAIGVPATAVATCFAILGWIKFPFNSIMCITPFLVMGIGVDDAFLLLHSWRRHGHLDTKERMRAAVHEIGPSMAITSATNTLAFGIGIASSTPLMSAFCLCTCIAICLDFVFEFLIFCPLLAFQFHNSVLCMASNHCLISGIFRWFSWDAYVNVLFSPFGRLFVVVFTFFIYICAVLGVKEMKPAFDPSKTFPRDSDLLPFLQNFQKIQQEYTPINFISLMPDLSNSHDVTVFFEMIHRLENSEGCYGPERTQLMLRNFIEVLSSRSYEDLPKYLEERDLDWTRRAMKIDSMRKIIDDYANFKPSLFDYDSTIYDLIITVKEEMLKSVMITFFCMTAACAFMIPSLIGASMASLSMLSISFSLLGFLSIWGQDLDPVTMINVLMAIGFSVDFSAHICYHYHLGVRKGSFLSGKEGVLKVLQVVGRPMFEASFSTIICMTPLFFVPVYIIVSFAKTICIVASLGLLHGLVIIPVCLFSLSRNQQRTSPLELLLKVFYFCSFQFNSVFIKVPEVPECFS
uniref:SSD domain-containing protein n=1 Tax=Angiostrongylus cantonensis TaxID=6313 RepID=A0A158PAQ0_ANGCA